MGKIKETRQLYKTTLKEISSSPSNWRTFLDSSAWNFKYDFDDQVLIFAQRPDARACATMDEWNRKPAIDMVNSTRLTEVLLWWLLRKGEYNLKDFEKPELKVEAVSGAFFVIKTKIFEKCNFFDENTFLFYEEDILASKIKKLEYIE